MMQLSLYREPSYFSAIEPIVRKPIPVFDNNYSGNNSPRLDHSLAYLSTTEPEVVGIQ